MPTHCEPDVHVGSIWSVGSVTLTDRDHVFGFVRTEGVLTAAHEGETPPHPDRAIIDDLANTAEGLGPLPLSAVTDALAFNVAFPSPGADFTWDTGSTTIFPGNYGNVVINGGTVTFRGDGHYTMTSLFVAAGATITAASLSDAIEIYISGSMTWHGVQTGAATRFRFVVDGTNVDISVTGGQPFTGIVIARNADLVLFQQTLYTGSFFGRSTDIEPNATFHHMPWNGTFESMPAGSTPPGGGGGGTITAEGLSFSEDPQVVTRGPLRIGRSLSEPTGFHHSVTVSGDTYTIDFALPLGVGMEDVALYTDFSSLIIGADTRVLGAVRGFGTVVNVSDAETDVEAGVSGLTETGNIWSTGDIQVGGNAHVHGFARTDGLLTVDEPNGGVVDDPNPPDQGEPIPQGPPFMLEITFAPSNPGGSPTAGTGTTVALEPNQYGTITIEEDASIELSSGQYLIEELEIQGASVETLGRVRVRANQGPVELVVRNLIDFVAAFTTLHIDLVAGNASQFRLVYLGETPLTLTAPFSGTVFSPQAKLTLAAGASPDDEFVGGFFADSLETLAGVVVRQQAFFTSPTPQVGTYFYGFSGDVGAGPYERALPVEVAPGAGESGGGTLTIPAPNSTITIEDSRTYSLSIVPAGDPADDLQTLVIQSRENQRPFIVIEGETGNAANLRPAPRDNTLEDPPARRFEANGIWFGTDDDSDDPSRDFVVESSQPEAEVGFDWDEIVLRHCTLDPGGTRADKSRVAALKLTITGRVRRLIIEGSIVGPIEVAGTGLVDEIVIRDSIVDASQLTPDANQRRVAIRSTTGVVRLNGVTVFGDIHADILEASDTLVTGQLVAADTQASCFRFSAASEGEQQRLPRLFEAHILPDGIQSFFFTSRRFGDPGYAQLSELAPDVIREGAESGSEMGVFSLLLNPIRFASILAKVDELKPIGVLAQYIFEGDDATAAPDTEETGS